jgi:transcriptional regulator with GAF, ATPase, and Fis domain
MVELQREERLNQLAVSLVNTLTGDYDLDDLLETLVAECKDLLDVTEVGLVLSDPRGELHVMAATTESAGHLEALQLRTGEGPCIDAFHSMSAVIVVDVERMTQWPTFREVALLEGYRGVHAVPLKVGRLPLGAMNLFSTKPGDLNEVDAKAAQALADIASIGIVTNRVHARQELVQQQLESALESRVVIEQAKGVVSEQRGISTEEAFARIRAYARNGGLRLQTVAKQIVESKLRV